MTVRYIPVHLPELTDPPIFNAAAVAIRLRAMLHRRSFLPGDDDTVYREARAMWWATLLLAGVTLVFGAYLLGMM